MAANTKTLSNMSKHLTLGQIEAREQAEGAVMPCRRIDAPRRQVPELIRQDKAALRYWRRILKDMQDVEILDILDTDALGIYCAKMARRDDLQEHYLEVRGAYEIDPDTAKLKNMMTLSAELQAAENSLLSYATKLGLTPDGRARLARKIAEQAADDPDGDLFA